MLESDKKEIQLSLNSFNVPSQNTGIKAWIQLVTQLLFLRKGTYQSDPNMGVGLQDYEFTEINNTINELTNSITEQIRTYLPDVPFDSVTIERLDDNHPNVLLVMLNFTTTETAVIAADINNIDNINFAVAI